MCPSVPLTYVGPRLLLPFTARVRRHLPRSRVRIKRFVSLLSLNSLYGRPREKPNRPCLFPLPREKVTYRVGLDPTSRGQKRLLCWRGGRHLTGSPSQCPRPTLAPLQNTFLYAKSKRYLSFFIPPVLPKHQSVCPVDFSSQTVLLFCFPLFCKHFLFRSRSEVRQGADDRVRR